jgi:DNA-directed RNA polymerase subunit RPC12/RpoP
MRAAPEQLPALCRNCGAPARVEPSGAIGCPYCGMRDVLPPDPFTRMMELKRRLHAASRAAGQLEGLERSLAYIFEDRGAFLRATSAYLVVFVVVCLLTAFQSYGVLASAPDDLEIGLVLYAMLGPALAGGFVFAFGFALLVGRFRYRRAVRPHLFARPPLQPGAPARCRACGAELPAAREAVVTCRFCSTQNLVTGDVLRQVAGGADAEAAFYRARAMRAQAGTAKLGAGMTRIAFVTLIAVYLAIFGLAALASFAISRAA